MTDISKYQDLFSSESGELLDKLDSDLIKLEKNPQDSETILALMRNAHTLKGEAATMGYGEISNLTHSFEGMVENIKNKLSQGGATSLFGALDEIRNLVTNTTKGNGRSKANTLVDRVGELEAKDQKDEALIFKTPESFQTASEVRVKIEKLDRLINLIGELMVNKLRVINDISKPLESLEEYERLVDQLQYEVLKLRVTPLDEVFNRFPRMIRDLAINQKKQIDLVISGGEIELDRGILDKIGEPLVHLLRNAADHGIMEKGIITLSAKRIKDKVEISVADNGRGIDWEKIGSEEALFSGLSTSSQVTQISGRGVGLTVVKSVLNEIGGVVRVFSEPGKGTTFTMTLPVSLAIIKALLVNINEHRFAVPLTSVDRLISLDKIGLKKQADQDIMVVDDEEIPLIQLAKLFRLSETVSFGGKTAIIVQTKNKRVGFVIDQAQTQQDIIVKPLAKAMRQHNYFSAVTILGDGLPIPIIDIGVLGTNLT